jgi:Na+-driven multidrug efflux pump
MNWDTLFVCITYAVCLLVCFVGSQYASVAYIRAAGRIQYAIPYKILEYFFLFLVFVFSRFLWNINGIIYYLIDALVFSLCIWQFVKHRKISREILHRQFHASTENKVNRVVRQTILRISESTYGSDN